MFFTNDRKPFKYIKFFLIYLIILFFPFSVNSHPGRTDENGGHWDRKEETYHFHSGEYSGHSSSGGTFESEYEAFTPPYEPPTNNPYKQKNPTNNTGKISIDFWGILFLIFIMPFLISFIITTISVISEFIYENCLEKHLPRYKINTLKEKISEFLQYQDEITETVIKIFDLELKFQIPDLYEIGADNLPKDKNSNLNWGKSFTLYGNEKGTKLHTKYNCYSAIEAKHIYWYRNDHSISKSLCKKCAKNYVLPDMSWYKDYLKCEQIKTKQLNIENKSKNLQREIEIIYKKCNSINTKILILFGNKNKKALQEVNKQYLLLLEKKII